MPFRGWKNWHINQSQFKTSIACSFHEYWDSSPDIQVVAFFPIEKSQFSLDQFVFGELAKLSGATVFAIQSMVHGRPNIKFGLHIHNMCETKIDALGLEKCLRKKVAGCECGSPQMGEIGTPFQDSF